MKKIIKTAFLVLLILCLYNVFAYYKIIKVEKLQSNCDMNIQTNNCIVVSTSK